MRSFFTSLVVLIATGQASTAQPTNAETYQSLAIVCLGTAPGSHEALLLNTPESMPYLRSALVSYWNDQSRRIFLADSVNSNMPKDLPRLSYKVEEASVSYHRIRKKRILRNVNLATHATLITTQGALLKDETCREQHTDTLSVSDLEYIESRNYSETQAPPPQTGWIRRVFQPVMLTAASVLSVYLFFSLRSDSSDDGN